MSDKPNENASPESPRQAAYWPAMLGKFGTVAFGMLLLLVGLAMLDPEEFAQSNTQIALASAIAAFGIGIIATVFLPHSIEVEGKNFKPLGLDVKASGGAAVFVVVLAFLYFSNTAEGNRGNQAVVEAAEPSPTPSPPQNQSTVAGTGEPAPAETPAPQPVATQAPPATSLRETDRSAAVQSYYFAETYCSDCCPSPLGCYQVGIGESRSADDARVQAIDNCRRNGGGPTCALNVTVSQVYRDDF